MDGDQGKQNGQRTSNITACGEGFSETSAYNNTAKFRFVPLL
jgi:hypothetical protein